MEQHIPNPALWSFLLQAIALIFHIPISYIAYRSVRPLKRKRLKHSLAQLGIVQTKELEEMMAGEYRTRHYIWPLCLACVATFVSYAWVHPYAIRLGVTAGLFEDVINIFRDDSLPPRLILAGRFVFWGWFGAWIYSFHLTWRRFLNYDLTPSVYIFSGNRFALAVSVSTIVGVGVGTFSTWVTGMRFDVSMMTVCVTTFFVGFFPESGINWIAATAKKALKSQEGIAKEIRLAEIEGLSIWHQGRLKQEGIENVQNLSTADVPALVVTTPFTVNQIVDWVDQAILLTYASGEQFEKLEKVGLRCASDVLTAAGDSKRLNQMANATGLNKDGLRMLHLALQSASNIKIISSFRQRSSIKEARPGKATVLQPFENSAIPPTMQMPREQEEIMFEEEQDRQAPKQQSGVS